jgi:SAM-dependent methyltransferase
MGESTDQQKDKSSLAYPRLYHAHHSRHMEDLPLWQHLAEMQGGPVLELGCGTGRVLVPLARTGFSVYGLDREAGMLAVLRERLPAGLVRAVRVFQADLTAFCLAKQFPLILVPCNTWSTLPKENRQVSLECIVRTLQPGGRFVASLPNPALLRRLPRIAEPEVEDDFPHPVSGNPVQVSTGWERTGREFRLHWHYDHLLPDGQVQRLSVQVRHDLAPFEAHLAELEAAGLEIETGYGDYDRSPYQPDSPYLILAARKPRIPGQFF